MRKATKSEASALVEYNQRRNMAISMFRPLEHQEDFFRNYAREYLFRGGVRCSVSGTIVWKCDPSSKRPVGNKPCAIDELEVGDTIVGVNRGKRVDLRASEVTKKWSFREEAYRLTTKRGVQLEGTHDHPVLACPPLPPRYHNSVDPDWSRAQWVKLSDLKPGWYVQMAYGPYVDWSGELDDEAYLHGLMDGDGSVECYDYGVMKLAGHRDESVIPWTQDYLSKHGIHNRVYKSSGLGVSLEWCNKSFKEKYLEYDPEWTPERMAGYICGLMDADAHVSEKDIVLTQIDEERCRRVQNWLLLFGIKSGLHSLEPNLSQVRPSRTWRLQISGSSVRRFRESIGFREIDKACKLENTAEGRRKPCNRRVWWDRVREVKSVGERDIVAISTSTETYVSNGIVSHNSGKSTCCGAKFASAAMDIPITLSDGTKLDMRQPWQKGRTLRMWVIGYDARHIGETIHRLLFQEGLFKIIRDKNTGLYRTYCQWEPDDAAREDEARPSPPLIPSRYIVPGSFDWENKKNREFKKVSIQDPVTKELLAEIYAYSSKADPKAGDPVDFIWIDEAIEYETHYAEWQSRLIDRKGNLIWSSWPNVNNEALQNLSKKAASQVGDKNPLAREIVVAMSANKTMSQDKIDEALGMFSTDADRQARDLGQYVTDQLRMYPLFHEDTHAAIRTFEIDGTIEHSDTISRLLAASGGTPPDNWTRELILDPGTSHPAILLCAIPPPSLGEAYVVYDEIYPGRADAEQLAELAKAKMGGAIFHRFIVDYMAGRQTSMGAGHRVKDNYSRAFKKRNMICQVTGHGFTDGSSNVGARIGILQEWMHIMPNGLPKLRIVTERCRVLCEQLRDYKKAQVNRDVKDDRPAPGQKIDLAACLEYFAASRPKYVRPSPRIDKNPGYAWYMQKFGHLKNKEFKSAELGPKYST